MAEWNNDAEGRPRDVIRGRRIVGDRGRIVVPRRRDVVVAWWPVVVAGVGESEGEVAGGVMAVPVIPVVGCRRTRRGCDRNQRREREADAAETTHRRDRPHDLCSCFVVWAEKMCLRYVGG